MNNFNQQICRKSIIGIPKDFAKAHPISGLSCRNLCDVFMKEN